LDSRFEDPDFALAFARLVTHYAAHDAWLEDGQLLREARALAGIPGVIVNGRFDLQAPLGGAWALYRAWPAADLVVVDEAGHAYDHPGITEALVGATDRFAAG
jgi:proline iminopeptidase